MYFHPQTYNDPEPKSAQQTSQSSHMMPPKQPLYSVPPQPSSPYLGPPGSFPLSDLQSYGGPPRHTLAQTLGQSQMLPPSMSASPPAPFQISPPLHPHAQLSLHQSSLLNQPIRMQQSQPIISHQMGLQAPLHSPPLSQQVGLAVIKIHYACFFYRWSTTHMLADIMSYFQLLDCWVATRVALHVSFGRYFPPDAHSLYNPKGICVSSRLTSHTNIQISSPLFTS